MWRSPLTQKKNINNNIKLLNVMYKLLKKKQIVKTSLKNTFLHNKLYLLNRILKVDKKSQEENILALNSRLSNRQMIKHTSTFHVFMNIN